MQYTSRDLRRYNHLLQETDAVYHEMAQHWGLPDSVMGVLYTLCDAGGRCSVREVCRLGGMSKQTVNSALKKLEKGGTLYLTPGPGRNTRVYLTESGAQLARDTAGRLMELENRIYASWTPEEQALFLRLNRDFAEKLTALVREEL